jgi:hypothetical protein
MPSDSFQVVSSLIGFWFNGFSVVLSEVAHSILTNHDDQAYLYLAFISGW